MTGVQRESRYGGRTKSICSKANDCGYSWLPVTFKSLCSTRAGDCGRCDLYTFEKGHETIALLSTAVDFLQSVHQREVAKTGTATGR